MDRYSYRNFFENLYNKLGQDYAFVAQCQEEARRWKQEFRQALKDTLGLDMLENLAAEWKDKNRGNEVWRIDEPADRESPEVNRIKENQGNSVRLLENIQEEGYTRYKFLMETLPEVYMPFYMLVPDGISAQNSGRAVVAIPAHGANKETVAGVPVNEAVREKLRRSPKEAYGLEFVRRGYVVFCPDPPGYGERLEPMAMEDTAFMQDVVQDPLGSSCKNLAQTAEAFGLSLTALEIWDLMRLMDFVTDCPEVDRKRIGCVGFSGGGQYAMWLAAMDDRIRAAVVSGYVHGYYDSILDVHLCPCNYAPRLWRLADISDICSLIAPRSLFVENGLQDPLNGYRGIEGPKEQVEKIRQTYRLYGKEECLRHITPEGTHQWYGECYGFMDEML